MTIHPDRLEPLGFFVGEWRGEGTLFASEHAPEHSFDATFAIAPILGGTWISGEYRDEASPEHPTALHGREIWGFDAASNLYVSHFFTNAGEAGTLTGSGWRDRRWEWTGRRSIGDAEVPFKAVFARDGDDAFTLRPMLRPGNDWLPVAELRFTR